MTVTHQSPASHNEATPLRDDPAHQEKTLSGTFDKSAAERIDRYLSRLPESAYISREKIKEAIENGFCTIDGIININPSRKLHFGEYVVCSIHNNNSPLNPSNTPVKVLYEDADIAVIIKPAGLTVHPCPSCTGETLVHRLLSRFPELRQLGGQRPGIVHRLDHDTDGVMIIALSERAQLRLNEQFSDRLIHKTYLAFVRGILPSEGYSAKPIGRHPVQKTKMSVFPDASPLGRTALTRWRRLYTDNDGLFSIAAVRLYTGRTHQIRVHLSDAGFPLVGDKLYGNSKPFKRTSGIPIPDPAPRQMLHAWKIAFNHPVSGEKINFCAPIPDDMWQTARTLTSRMARLIITGCPGCGKSTLTKYLSELGIPTWSADNTVRLLYEPCGEVARILAARYGSFFIDDKGSVLKPKVLAAMQNDPSFRRELEAVVHPMVAASMESAFRQYEEKNVPIAVAEVPLWFESNFPSKYPIPPSIPHFVIGVHCPASIRHKRLKQNRGWDEETIHSFDQWQWNDEQKAAACDMTIDNSTSQDELRNAASSLRDEIIARTAKMQSDIVDALKKSLNLDNGIWPE